MKGHLRHIQIRGGAMSFKRELPPVGLLSIVIWALMVRMREALDGSFRGRVPIEIGLIIEIKLAGSG